MSSHVFLFWVSLLRFLDDRVLSILGILPISLMLPNRAGSTCQNDEVGRWPKREAPAISLRWRPAKVGTDWCGNVKSITEQIQHTLNIAKVTNRQRVNQPARRITDAVRSQPEVDTG
jgi:hypothetical protein